jgi:hypothetical protein
MTILPTFKLNSSKNKKIAFWTLVCDLKLAAITWVSILHFLKTLFGFSRLTLVFSCMWTDRTELGGNFFTRFGDICIKIFVFFDTLLDIFHTFFCKILLGIFYQLSS